MQTRVQVDIRQVLTLLGCEGFCGRTHVGHPIQLFIRASGEQGARMNIRYRVELSQTERDELKSLLSAGRHAARKLKRAQILLAADAGASDEEIARNVGVGGSTVYRTKRRFVLGNLEAALSEGRRPGRSPASAKFYLPPYSPDLNPIEQFFSKLKALLRKAAVRTIDKLWEIIGLCLADFSPRERTAYLTNSGYSR
jgi:transposase